MKAGLILFFCFCINLIYSQNILKEKYDELIKNVIPITSGNINTQADNELASDCVGGSCPIR